MIKHVRARRRATSIIPPQPHDHQKPFFFLIFPFLAVILYLFPRTLQGLLWDMIDLLVQVYASLRSALYLYQQHPEVGAPKVHSQEVTLL